MPKKNSNSFLQKTRSGWKRVHVANKAHSALYEELKPGLLVEVAGKGIWGKIEPIRDRVKPRDEYHGELKSEDYMKLPDLSNRVAGMSIVAKDKPVASKEDVFKMLGDRLQGTGIKSLKRI